MRETRTLKEYHIERKKAIEYTLLKLRNRQHSYFTWKDFQHFVKEYQIGQNVNIITPIRGVQGGWEFIMYQRVNRCLNILVQNSVIRFELHKNKRKYSFNSPGV